MQQKSSRSVVSGAGRTESAIRRELKDAIISQKLAPGQKVTETGLAELLSTSRTVAKNLIEQLTVQHFLVSVSARMTRVSPLTVVSIKENFLLRRMIMPELIAMSISNVDLKAMAKMNQRISSTKVNKDDDDQVLELLRLNRKFNLMLIEDSKYPLPLAWARLLEDMAMRIYWIYVKQHGKLPFPASQHELQIKAMQDDNPKRVESIARETLSRNEERILDAVFSSEQFYTQDLIV
ncbi:MAG: GntR family transcriptional regulator [Pseudomonadota bacterium]